MPADRRGMTLVEMLVVVALIGIIGSLALSNFDGVRRRAALREAAVTLNADLGRARSLATSGRTDFTGFSASDRVFEAGVQFTSETEYRLFVDKDDQVDGNEVYLGTVQMVRRGYPVALASPPAEVRFRKDGTLKDAIEARLVVIDTENQQRRFVVIPLGGKGKVTD